MRIPFLSAMGKPIGPLLEPCWVIFWGPPQHANRRGGFWRHGADPRPLKQVGPSPKKRVGPSG